MSEQFLLREWLELKPKGSSSNNKQYSHIELLGSVSQATECALPGRPCLPMATEELYPREREGGSWLMGENICRRLHEKAGNRHPCARSCQEKIPGKPEQSLQADTVPIADLAGPGHTPAPPHPRYLGRGYRQQCCGKDRLLQNRARAFLYVPDSR